MVMVGGYGKLGAPHTLIGALAKRGTKDLTVVSAIASDTQKDGGINSLLEQQQIKRLITSSVGENAMVHEQFKKGELEVVLNPMGILAERVRSGGYGIPAFYSRVGIGTYFEEGGVPIKLHQDGKTVIAVNLALPKRQIEGQDQLLNKTLLGDYSLVKAWKADTKGNCVLKLAARNFNPDMAIAGKMCIVEADELVEPGALDGDDVHIPNIFVHKVVQSSQGTGHCCHRGPQQPQACPLGTGETKSKRTSMAKRAAQEVKSGSYVVLGSGVSRFVEYYVKPDLNVFYVYPETGVFGATHDKPRIGSCGNVHSETHSCCGELLDGSFKPIKLRKNASITRASEAFSAVRGGHLNLIILDGYQVSANGDFANIRPEGGLFLEPHANIDLAASGTPVIALMELVTKGRPNLLPQCTLPLTGRKCVHKLVTDVAVFEFRPEGLTLAELAPGLTVDAIRSMTPCPFRIASHVGTMTDS